MKNHLNYLLYIISVLVFSILFFKQSAGINFLVFSFILIFIFELLNNNKEESSAYYVIMAGIFLSAFMVVIQNSLIAFIACIVSILLLTGLRFNPLSSLLTAFISSIFSIIATPVYSFIGFFNKDKEYVLSLSDPEIKHFDKSLFIFIPLIISIIFISIYRIANPVYDAYIQIVFNDIITWGWIRFTLISFIIFSGIFYPVIIKELIKSDLKTPDKLIRKRNLSVKIKGMLALKKEYVLGTILLSCLNIILLSVILTDIYHLFISRSLPSGITHSEYVHNGVYMLIFSIISAIIILMYFFRANQNFYTKNILLRKMAYIWVLFNCALVIMILVKNQMYVSEFGYTLKRIGVYFYLFLCFIGLISSLIKLKFIKSNWFLFRFNTYAFYGVLLFASLFNWDKIITNYNVKYVKDADINYLIGLSDSNLPALIEIKDEYKNKYKLTSNQIYRINQKRNKFELEWKTSGWRSWNYASYNTYRKLNKNY